ncbi:acyltransferase [Limnohabitans sp. Rim8]|uniref:acyltransferase family protein n=1 Tax=Limnohabitans sp. Rim8 TaxID=1100718 RepID=UPI0025E1BE64|nr:acyltransferase [Limnohabitans sp. Rim8]
MGYLRFALAVLVLLSHAGMAILGLNPGVAAVIVFYAISGYVMSALISKHYALAASTGRFYLDRLLRIYPQYAIYALAASLWLFTVGQPTAFLNQQPLTVDWINNILIVPLNYFMYNGADRFTLVPPAWSLGAELLFYALAPWLWRHWRMALALALASLCVQATAWHGLVHTDWWGYRLLPGVLWVFVLGMALHRYQNSHPQSAHLMACLVPTAAAIVWAYLAWRGLIAQPYHREVLTGLALGIPLIHLLSRIPQTTGGLDQRLGDWSYGIFLNHFVIFWALDLQRPRTSTEWASVLLTSIALSALTQAMVEQRVLRWRRHWRGLNHTQVKQASRKTAQTP